MKICAVICEYNPFHNGHKRQLEEIRAKTECDTILCIMSGNFTQRGEAAVFHKRVRARHAIENGADIVLELPTAFAVSPAELFARGAVKLLSDIPAVTHLAFGCESGDKESFLAAARATLREDKSFRAALKESMKNGTSYLKARNELILSLNSDVDESLLSSPNNILGTEYCRSLLLLNSKIEPVPLLRVGGGYSDTALYKDFSSATALRSVLGSDDRRAFKALKRNLPLSVFRDAGSYRPLEYRKLALYALLDAPASAVAQTPDCSEGLENRLKALARSNPDYDAIFEKAVSKRYTRSRLKRIVLQNLLGVTLKSVQDFIGAPLYHRVLAVKKERAEELLKAIGEASYPALVRRSDLAALSREGAACFALDSRANDVFNLLAGKYESDLETQFI